MKNNVYSHKYLISRHCVPVTVLNMGNPVLTIKIIPQFDGVFILVRKPNIV